MLFINCNPYSSFIVVSLGADDDNTGTLSIEAQLVRLRKEKIQYEDLINKQEQYIDETEKLVNRANSERDALAQTVELMKVEIKGKDSEITQLKLQLKRITSTSTPSSSVASSPKTSFTPNNSNNSNNNNNNSNNVKLSDSSTDMLRIELEKRMNESVAQANELKRVKDLVNSQIEGKTFFVYLLCTSLLLHIHINRIFNI